MSTTPEPASPVDTTTLEDLRAALDDDEMFTDVVESFLTEGPEQVGLLASAAGSDDDAVLSVAHRLKGSAMSLGLPGLVRLCEQVEDSPATAPGLVDQIRRELDDAAAALRGLLSRLG